MRDSDEIILLIGDGLIALKKHGTDISSLMDVSRSVGAYIVHRTSSMKLIGSNSPSSRHTAKQLKISRMEEFHAPPSDPTVEPVSENAHYTAVIAN
jgi:hypothetical protein